MWRSDLKSPCINSRFAAELKGLASSMLFAIALLSSLAFDVDAAVSLKPCDADPMSEARIVYASLKGGEKAFEGRTVMTVPLGAAAANACSGDVIQLVRDDYQLHGDTITVRRRAQKFQQKPVILRGLGAETTISGGTAPGYRLSPKSMKPRENEHSCLRIKDQSWIVIENIDFADCWPIAILSIDSRYITLRDSRIVGSTFGFYGLGTCEESAGTCDRYEHGLGAHHYLIENVQWIQDPPDGPLPARGVSIGSGEMWRRYRWIDVHDPDRPYHYFNGALFGSWNILGGLVFRNNHVLNAFNVLRLNAPKPHVVGQRNLNIEIYDNRFQFIRDNTIEPEREVTNLWVHRNRSANTYAALSTDGVGGNYWYVFGNVHWFNEAPSQDCRLDPSCRQCLEDPLCAKEHMHRRGKAVKLGEGPFPGEAFYIFHNSTFQRHPSAAEGQTRNLHVWNNVIQVCKPEGDPADRCEPSQSFEGLCYRTDYDFKSNVTNDPGCMAPCGQPEAEPICVYKDVYDPTITPLFNNPIHGDLRLSPASPARGAASALALKLPDGTLWSNQVGGSLIWPDAGAYDGDELLAGPPFVLFDPDDRRLVAAYAERPRIVRVSWDEEPRYWIQRLFFSVPVYFDRPGQELMVRVKTDDTSPDLVAASEPCTIEGRALRCRFAKDRPFPAEEQALIFLPRGIKSKRRGDLDETAGLALTLWASVDRRICLEPDQCPNRRPPGLH
jgi:hypothetical protein